MTFAAMAPRGDDMSMLGPIVDVLQDCIQVFPLKRLSHVRRDANHVAHRLARVGLGQQLEAQWWEHPLGILTNVLMHDSSL